MSAPSNQALPTAEEKVPERGSPRPSPRGRVVVALVPMAVGACGVVGAVRLGVGQLAEPGPGLWPLIVSVGILVFSVALVADRVSAATIERFDRGTLIVVAALVSLLGFVFLIERIGFETPAVALLVLWLRVLGRESWRLTIGVAVGATAAIYLLFIVALGVNLPHAVHL